MNNTNFFYSNFNSSILRSSSNNKSTVSKKEILYPQFNFFLF